MPLTLWQLAHAIYRDFFSAVKLSFLLKSFYIFLILAQNIDCGYTLEPSRRGGSKSTHNLCVGAKIKTNRYTPANPSFFIYIKVRFKHGLLFLMNSI